MANTMLIGSELTETGQNITAEHLLFTYTSSGETCVAVQIAFAALNAAAASITVRCEHEFVRTVGATPTTFLANMDIPTFTKFAAANTAAGLRLLGPFHLPDGEKLNVYALSSNPNDTSVTYYASVLDATGNLQSVNQTGDTFIAIQSIGTGTGAALNFAAAADNTGGAIEGVTFVGSQTGTYASTSADDGTYHNITHTANAIDIVYSFNVGAGRSASKVVFIGYLTSSNDTITVQAFNGSTWDTRKTITGINTTTDGTFDIALLSSHTGTGVNAGRVLIRFVCTAQSSPVLHVDELLISAQNLGQTVGYSQGAIWIDTDASNTNTTPFVDGTADNPVSTIAAAMTLSASTGLKRFSIAPGSSITFASSQDGHVFCGGNWTLVLNGQSISGAYIEGATVSGNATGASQPTFVDCRFGAGSYPPFYAIRCGVNTSSGAKLTAASAGQFALVDCYSLVAGSGTPYFDFSGTGGVTGINIRRWSGGTNLVTDSNCTTTVEVVTGGGQTIVTGGGNVEVRGIPRAVTVTLSGSETVQIDAVTGPITLSGTATAATVNIYGVYGSLTNTATGSTVANLAVGQRSEPPSALDNGAAAANAILETPANKLDVAADGSVTAGNSPVIDFTPVLDAIADVLQADDTRLPLTGVISVAGDEMSINVDTLLANETIAAIASKQIGQYVVSGASKNIYTYYAREDTGLTAPLLTITFSPSTGRRTAS